MRRFFSEINDIIKKMDEKALLANYSAMLAAAAAAAQQNNGPPPGMMNVAGSFPAPLPPTAAANIHPVLPTQPQMSMTQAQYMAAILQQNDMFNLIQNALASGVPTLDVPTIFSYLGYTNTFSSHTNGFNVDPSGSGSTTTTTATGSGSSKSKNNLDAKYAKLMDVVQEIGRDVRPLYTGSKTASDRLRRQINQARHLVRECLIEVDRRAPGRTSSGGSNQ